MADHVRVAGGQGIRAIRSDLAGKQTERMSRRVEQHSNMVLWLVLGERGSGFERPCHPFSRASTAMSRWTSSAARRALTATPRRYATRCRRDPCSPRSSDGARSWVIDGGYSRPRRNISGPHPGDGCGPPSYDDHHDGAATRGRRRRHRVTQRSRQTRRSGRYDTRRPRAVEEYRDDRRAEVVGPAGRSFTSQGPSRNSSSDGSVGVPPWSTRNSNRTWPGFLAMALPSGPNTAAVR